MASAIPANTWKPAMDDAMRSKCSVIAGEIKATAIPDANKQSALWCVERLPALYAHFRETSQSRYGDEITRLIQAIVKELMQSKQPCQKAEELARAIPEQFKAFHEEWGLSTLVLKIPPAKKAPRASGRSPKINK